MRKIRVGNDFLVAWRIKRAGINEDLTNAVNMSVVASVKAEGQIHSVVVPFDIVDDSIIRVEMTPAIAQWEGIYNFVLKYEFEYPSYVDNNEKVAVDKNAFIIVSRTSQADEITLIDIESDVLIGLKGEKGDSAFTVWNKANGGDNTYQDWIDFLQSPANDAIVDADAATLRANNAADLANTKADEADIATESANTATSQADDARDGALSATSDARDAIADTQQATSDADIATSKANTATTQANTARDSANVSALNADNKASLADIATGKANTATSNANTATDLANTATSNANEKALYAKTQGDYAKAQGDIVAGYTLITSIEGTQEFNELNIN